MSGFATPGGGLSQAELDTILADYPTTPTPLTAGILPKSNGDGTISNSRFRDHFTSGYCDIMDRLRLYYLGTSQVLDMYGEGGVGRVVWQLGGYSGARFQHAEIIELACGSNVRVKTGTTGLGFFGNEVARGAAIADATDAATVITQLNSLLAFLRSRGDINT